MEIRCLTESDANQFSNLIINMYSNLNNLEWFTPMPYDIENVTQMIKNPRFYIIGAFENNNLVGVSSLDYKCGKLIGKINFPSNCNTNKLVEIGFNLVHSNYRGQKIMQQLISFLLNKIKSDGFEWAFVKVHEDNIASNKSCFNKNFDVFCHYVKPVNKEDFYHLASQDFFNEVGKKNAQQTLLKFKNEKEIFVQYNILIQKL